MPGVRWGSRIIAAGLLLIAVLLGGCSALRLGYNAAPELAFRWFDGYADFDDHQSLRTRNGLSAWFAWHRRTQLPDYAGLLVRAQAEANADVTPARLCAWWTELGERLDVAVDHAVPDIAAVLVSFRPEQLANVEKQYAKKNAEFRDDYLDGDVAERAEKNLRRTADRAETLYGRLDATQRSRLAHSMGQSPFDAELWFAERKRRQQDALQMLRRLHAERATPEQAQAAVRAYVQRMRRSPNPAYSSYQERLTQFNCALSAELHNATTPAQRQHAVGRLKSWEHDLRALISG